jgi:hypothetical protein
VVIKTEKNSLGMVEGNKARPVKDDTQSAPVSTSPSAA